MARDDQAGKTSEFIDKNLKQIFQQEIERDIPDRFTNLIEQLRAKDASTDNSSGGKKV
ncbi:regulator [Roseobacter denitrificans]|uniref:NepR family anti-sigma factor n=1 Tax=Roseobacter denitrificans TaxID=2434 RepID=UPI0002E78F99|nr:NepR family anti-sigma factor [Roseobacter denitrificans]AVL54705.1 regulator [Roseobacter denitrificans]SFG36529.1 hypothetical protein SAMN05443635_11496 [Roseobacter denitrificans OCh 114]